MKVQAKMTSDKRMSNAKRITVSDKFNRMQNPIISVQYLLDKLSLLVYNKKCTSGTDGVLGIRQSAQIANRGS